METEDYIAKTIAETNEIKKNLYPLFIERLEAAATEFKDQYFILDTYHVEALVKKSRERVYAYELYHLLRNALADDFSPFYLTGEVDKRSHYLFEEHDYLRNTKPDLLLHTPGYPEGDLIVMEIKSLVKLLEYQRSQTHSEIRKDLIKLSLMVTDERLRYYRGIFIIYGADEGRLAAFGEICRAILDDETDPDRELIKLEHIDLCYHESTKKGMRFIDWHEIL